MRTKVKTKAKTGKRSTVRKKVSSSKRKTPVKKTTARKATTKRVTSAKRPARSAAGKKGLRSKSLVQSWLEVELNINNKSLAEALRDLNKSLGSAHTHSRVREWEDSRGGRGDRLPRNLRIYMAKKVIKHVLQNSGINVTRTKTPTLNKLVEQLQ